MLLTTHPVLVLPDLLHLEPFSTLTLSHLSGDLQTRTPFQMFSVKALIYTIH